MITVMLADDNLFSLEYYSTLVDWGKYGFQLIATAEDGIEAYEKFTQFRPDVVITDIQMPGLSGIELAAKIRELSQSVIVIFLSSYNKFDYARSAMNLSVNEYILKNELNHDSLIRKLSEIKDLYLKKEAELRQIQTQYLSAFFKNDEELFLELSSEKVVSEKPLGLLIFEQDHIPEFLVSHSHRQVPSADSKSVNRLLEQYFPDMFTVSHYDKFSWLCVCSPNEDTKNLAERIGQILNSMLSSSFTVFSFGVFSNAEECGLFYQQYAPLFERSYFTNAGSVLDYSLHEKIMGSAASAPDSSLSEELPEEMEEFEDHLQKLEQEETLADLDRIFFPAAFAMQENPFIQRADLVLSRLEEYQEKCSETGFSLYENADRILSFPLFLKWIKDRTAALIQALELFPPAENDALARAIQCICQKYMDPFLSIESVAKSVGLSVNGLNYLFKKAKNETAGRFLTKVRMEKAAELLTESHCRISDLPQKTGYSSASYFTRAFRRYYGMSPSEYQMKTSGSHLPVSAADENAHV